MLNMTLIALDEKLSQFSKMTFLLPIPFSKYVEICFNSLKN